MLLDQPRATRNVVYPVGRGGRNIRPDVQTVQDLLNDHMKPPDEFLAVDGICGPKTQRAIILFQRNVVGLSSPDGRVDPSGRTISKLNDPCAKARWNQGLVTLPRQAAPEGVKKYQGQMRDVFVKAGKQNEWGQFWDGVVQGSLPEVKKVLGAIGLAEDARSFARAYLKLREWGLSPREIGVVIKRMSGLQNGKAALKLFEEISNPVSKLGRAIGVAAKAGKAFGFIAFLIEYIDHWRKGDYHMAVVEVYKAGMGRAIPWAGIVEALQSLVEAIWGKSLKSNKVFTVLRSIDPIGLGAAAVDSAGVLVQSAIDAIQKREVNLPRLGRLVDRLKSGPTKMFAEYGEKHVYTLIVEVSSMSSKDWTNLAKQPWRDFKSWWDKL
jgi:hypothetical protein